METCAPFCMSLLHPRYESKTFAQITAFLCFGEQALFKDVDSILELTNKELDEIIKQVSEIHKKQKEEMEKMKAKSSRPRTRR